MDQIILSQIPIQDLIELVKQAVREELSTGLNTLQTTKQEPGYLDRKEVAKLFHITLPTLAEWTKTGRVKAYRIGRRVLYKSNEIDQALKQIQTSIERK